MTHLSSASRRTALKIGLASVLAAVLDARGFGIAAAQEATPSTVGSPDAKFDFEALSAQMKQLAANPYKAPAETLPDVIQNLSYDEHRAIRFRPEHALWRAEPVEFHLQAFYPGWVFKDTTTIYIGENGVYNIHEFDPSDFEYRPPLDPSKFQNLKLSGIAGFRIHAPLERPDYFDELVTFLGASYFRALGTGTRYGLSARGLAINTATADTEEFPRFTAFYIEQPNPGDDTIRIMAALDSPSLTGAFAFNILPGHQTVMDVRTRLFFRNEVTRLGIAPLTSMFFFAENDPPAHQDFRPEVHDSDGLCIHRDSGERVWRPLRNPETLALSYFEEINPRGFGLLQRDRQFSHYEDTEARYDLRPSLVIEPIGDWGKGIVQLVEIPSDSEANDNIVAFWVPEAKPGAGDSLEHNYRMRWGLSVQEPDLLAKVAGTYIGVGGNAADAATSTKTRRFAIDFEGGTMSNLPADATIEPLIDVPQNARLINSSVSRLPDNGWRLSLELEREDSQAVELRVKLSMLQRIVSETWLYQWTGTV